MSYCIIIDIPTPPPSLKSKTFILVGSLPSAGVKDISKVPGLVATKSVALYCGDETMKLHINKCLTLFKT